jgi:hypothetical protein
MLTDPSIPLAVRVFNALAHLFLGYYCGKALYHFLSSRGRPSSW